MESLVIPLDAFLLGGKYGTLSLQVSASLHLSRPAECLGPANAEELLAMGKEGRLWVMRAGSCRICISPLLDGDSVEMYQDSILWESFAMLVEEASVGFIGLSLLRPLLILHAADLVPSWIEGGI